MYHLFVFFYDHVSQYSCQNAKNLIYQLDWIKTNEECQKILIYKMNKETQQLDLEMSLDMGV